MAKAKKTTKQSGTSRTAGGATSDKRRQAEALSSSISASAQQIWLAGVGAFGRAQVEGSRLFEGLVKEGVGLEKTARTFAGGRATEMRDAVETTVDHARGRAADTWSRLEKGFEDRVQRVLGTLGVPSRDEIDRMDARIDALVGKPPSQPRATAAKKARKTAVKTSASKAPAKKSGGTTATKTATTKRAGKTAARKTVSKPAAPRKATRKTATR